MAYRAMVAAVFLADLLTELINNYPRVVRRTDAIRLTSRAVAAEECRRGKIVELKQMRVGSMSPSSIVPSQRTDRS